MLRGHDYKNVVGWLKPKPSEPMAVITQKELDEIISDRNKNWKLYVAFKDAGFATVEDVIKALEEKQSIIRAVDGFRIALTKSLGIEGADWQRIVDEVNKFIKEHDDTFNQAKVADTLWDAIVKQTGLQVVKYTDEGVKALVDSLETLKKAVPEGYRIVTDEEYKKFMARKTLDRFSGQELIIEGLKKIFKIK